MPLHITNTDNVTDDATLELDGADSVATAIVGGTTYLFAGALIDDGVSVFSVAADGSLTNVNNVTDAGALELDGVRAVTTALVGGVTYLFATGINDDGVSVFSVAANGTLTNVHNVTDDATLALNGAFGATTAVVGGTTYLFVTSVVDNGVSVFSVAANGALTNVHNVTDDATLELNQARGVTTAIVGGTTYLFVAGNGDDGLSVFSVAANGTLTNVDNVDDSEDPTLQLDGANGLTTAVIGGTTYLFVAAVNDDGVNVLSVAANGTLTSVDTVTGLGAPAGVTTAVIGGVTYLFVACVSVDTVRVFSVAADGSLTSMTNITDIGARELDGTEAVTTALVAGVTRLFAPGQFDDGVSVFSAIEPTPNDFDGDGKSDLLWRHDGGTFTEWQSAGNDFTPNVYVNTTVDNAWRSEGSFDFSGDGRNDLLWRNVSTGQFTIWNSNGNAFTFNDYVDGTVDTNWTVAGLADFNGDGRSDILWRHASGTFTEWQSTGTGFTSNVYVDGTVDPTWHLVAAADFNGDGNADLLWRNNNGTFTEWQSTGNGFTKNTYVDSTVDPTWHFAGTGDFNGDGKADIIWRNDNGTFTEWQSSGNSFTRNTYVDGTVDNTWQLAQIGDFNGDGLDDLLWRNNSGTFTEWQSTGNSFTPNVVINNTVAADWTLITHHYDLV